MPLTATVGGTGVRRHLDEAETIDNTERTLIDHHSDPMNWVRLILVALVALMALTGKVSAERLTLKHGLTQPFYASNLKVQWAASTNALPRTLRVFEVVPDPQPAFIISNLMAIGRFQPAERVAGFYPDMHLPKGSSAFHAPDDGRTLVYVPQQGKIEYQDEAAFEGPISRQKVEGVPEEATVLALALGLLPRLGISTNDLVHHDSGGLRCVFPTGAWGHSEQDTQIHRRGIGMMRLLDGFGVDGQRTVFMEFGSNAKLGKLEIGWPALRPKGSHALAQPEQIMKWITEGRAVVLSLSGPPDARYVHVADIQKLTVISIEPRYKHIDEDEPPKLVYPYAFLTALAEFGKEDVEQVILYCPIISEGLPIAHRPARAGFSIYPSSRSWRDP